jgi:lipopolysaccharide/colanic/teichoic acid biosynthesis glycosyltransferase
MWWKRVTMLVRGMWLKRAADLVVAAAALVVLSPVLAAIAACILLVDGRPLLFTQRRSGRRGQPFVLHKFRTMSTESDDPTTDAQRITRLGRLLRATSLDELPTLWDVARGAMSLVGPRPLPERYLDRYTAEQRRRLEVRPGITGLAQVRGRNLLSWEERFALDVRYVEDWSLAGDLKLLIETARSVVRREGIEAEGTVTMPEFWGSAAEEPMG